MSKKFLTVVFTAMFVSLGVACADNDRPISMDKLPVKAQQFITKYFGDLKVSFAKEEHDFLEVTYEVLFTNSTKIEFFRDGEWKEISCKYSSMPDGIVPEPIMMYVQTHFPDILVVGIERDRREIEVSLANKLELTFNLNYDIIDIDD